MKKIEFVKNENGLSVKSDQFQNVLKKAIAEKPRVRVASIPGAYWVRASMGDEYVVSFWKQDGDFVGQCECRGHEKGYFCYHLAAALLAHTGLVRAGLRCPALSVVGGRLVSV